MVEAAIALARMLSDAQYAVVLTGAGISTESGIPDFRTPGTGSWANVDPMEVAHMRVFMRDPARFWSFHRPRIDMLEGVEPNPGHRAVAELERRGIVKAVITQNIDRLHRRAGSEAVIEVHGSIDRGSCLQCGAQVDLATLVRLADAASDGVPRCDCGFPLKSGVVLFGEGLPPEAIDAAFDHAERADLMVVIGSSLLVSPVSQLPAVAQTHGARLAILTEDDTPYDDRADLRLRGSAGAVLAEAVAALDGRPTSRDPSVGT